MHLIAPLPLLLLLLPLLPLKLMHVMLGQWWGFDTVKCQLPYGGADQVCQKAPGTLPDTQCGKLTDFFVKFPVRHIAVKCTRWGKFFVSNPHGPVKPH